MIKYYFQLAVVVAAIMAINTYVGRPIKIVNESMQPVAVEGDIVWVDKTAVSLGKMYRGDVIVFQHPDKLKNFDMKRIAGLPKEKIVIKKGQIYVNGKPTKNEKIRKNIYINWGLYGQVNKTVRVPSGHYFVLGDNSLESEDSRNWGFLPKENIIGKAKSVFSPANPFYFH